MVVIPAARQRKFIGSTVLIAVSAAICLPAVAEAQSSDLTLVKDGRAQAVLVISNEAANVSLEQRKRPRKGAISSAYAPERLAANEIQEHVKMMSGTTLEIIKAADDLKGLKPIYIGTAAEALLEEAIRAKGLDPSAFALMVGRDHISIRGLSSEGTLFGAYELLEQLGVRWFMPGELGLVVPNTKTVTVKLQQTIQVPSFPSRHLQAVRAPEWQTRQRLAGPRFPSSHGIPGFGGKQAAQLFNEHPEFFSLNSGQRKNRQLCVSNPEVLKRATEAVRQYFRNNPAAEWIGMGANDGRGFCECEKCRALDGSDFDPFGDYESMTDRYVWFFNQVLDGIRDEFPDKRIGFYAYSVYNRPPLRVKPDPRIVPAVALITLCRRHGMDNPVCPEKSYEQWIIGQWGKIVPEVYYRGYWFNLADPGLPFFMISRIRQEVPLGKKLGIVGWRTETPPEWAGSCPSRYIAARLMWDHTADVDALMEDFYQKFFGPAAGPMQRYIEMMDRAVYESDYHTGSSWDTGLVYPAGLRAAARKALDEAARLAPAGLYAKRVWMYARSLDYLDAFLAMMESRTVHDYAAGKKALDALDAIREELWAHDPPLMGRKAKDYMERFFSTTTLQGYARTTNGNQFVAGLDQEWLFQIDPKQVGESVGWWKPEAAGGNWSRMRTCTSSWSNQGLRYYKGLAWYRQTVRIPEKYKGRRVFLWCGAIDEFAKVWVNGKTVGISPQITFKPFEVDATEAIEPGRDNVVVVCVRNTRLNELGTGGIMGPVMFYAPVGGPDAKLENLKPLGKTFPEY
ncbi:MAG: DUF4838 domain-containing protein [Phycisphaerales bacterium]|nr:MAG: DUF4838 domain-containing protein [Phycisphaerales bacterium]